jgi:putative ABC transport system permease protein
MGWLRRLANVFRQEQLNRELDEELADHVAEAMERGRSREDAARAFGSPLHHRERSRDIKLVPWVEALKADLVFGWRQLKKHRGASAAAVLSLALAIGATTAAFHLVYAVLLRPLPVAEPQRLFYLAASFRDHDGRPDNRDAFDYPTFRRYRQLVEDRADLLLIGQSGQPVEADFGAGIGVTKIYRQYVSGNVFPVFGLHPAWGRLLAPGDDAVRGANPVAVISYDCWTHLFNRDPNVLGKRARLGAGWFEIIGVAPKGFIGTEPGTVTDVYIPSMTNVNGLDSPGWTWFRIWLRPKPGFSPEQVCQPIQADLIRERQERLREIDPATPREAVDTFLAQKALLLPAASGASKLQTDYRQPLFILGLLVALVLLLACANVGNLLTAQSAARAREMALRVSIGAGRTRLIQLVLVESALLAAAATVLGTLFAWWSTPLVVSMLHVPEDPVRLVLQNGWLELVFSATLALAVTMLFGLAPALRASAVKPMSALRGGDDPHSRRRFMNGLLAAQMAFCVLVQFVAGLFVASFERLSHRPLGFSPEHVLVMDAEAEKQLPLNVWMQVADRLRQTPGVESASLSAWALLSGNRWSRQVRVPGSTELHVAALLDVSPAFLETMRLGLIGGRDLRPGDATPGLTDDGRPVAGVGIVNEAFARIYFPGQDPVGRAVEFHFDKMPSPTMLIVGYVRDAVYSDPREQVKPTVYVPLNDKANAAFLVRTAGDPLPLAPLLRRAVTEARSDIQVHTVNTQTEFVLWHMLRERMLATLSFFFALVALALAAVGLYGVLNYSVMRQRREIGIRMALGAGSLHVVRRVTSNVLAMVVLGSAAGLAAGLACSRFVESLLFEVKASDAGVIIAPLVILFSASLFAALPPAIWAVRIDPAETLRSE